MKRLGVDIDDVIFQTSEALKKVLDECEDEDILNHKLDIMRGDAVNPKIGEFFKGNAIPTILAAKPMKNVAEVIKKIRSQSNKVILITARGKKMCPGTEEITLKILKEYDIEYDDIQFNSMDKVKACKDNQIDYFIDDSPKHCLEVSKSLGIPVIGFLSEINREEMLKNHIKCVESWDELYDLLF